MKRSSKRKVAHQKLRIPGAFPQKVLSEKEMHTIYLQWKVNIWYVSANTCFL